MDPRPTYIKSIHYYRRKKQGKLQEWAGWCVRGELRAGGGAGGRQKAVFCLCRGACPPANRATKNAGMWYNMLARPLAGKVRKNERGEPPGPVTGAEGRVL